MRYSLGRLQDSFLKILHGGLRINILQMSDVK
jgi:hypothetical protein